LEFTQEYGFKHWYIKNLQPRGINNMTTDKKCLKNIKGNTDTLFIVTVRNVYDWVCSMYNKPWYMKQINIRSIYDFVSNKYLCYLDNCPQEYRLNNKHPYFIEKADNLIQLRNMKNEHFLKIKDHVKYFYIIRQENLLKDIKNMIYKFKLSHVPVVLKNYINPKQYNIDNKTIEFINKELNNKIDDKYDKINTIDTIDTINTINTIDTIDYNK